MDNEGVVRHLGAGTLCDVVPAPDPVRGLAKARSKERHPDQGAVEKGAGIAARALVGEDLHHDEDTLMKVRAGLRKVLTSQVLFSDDLLTDCISSMQNQGILFRERAK
jgi:hypothetical protein